VLAEGECEVIVNEVVVKTISSGESFGELAMLHNTKRSASIKALTECQLWGLDRHTFQRAVKNLSDAHYEENLKFVR
jgi:CRP-like cAMP-binding protein